MSFMPPLSRLKYHSRKVAGKSKLPIVLGSAIVVSLVLTIVSVVWYSLGGYANLDLSRPGYERERAEVRSTDTTKTYDTTGKVTAQAIDDFLTEYDGRVKELGGYGAFDDNILSDTSIQLTNPSTGSSANQ